MTTTELLNDRQRTEEARNGAHPPLLAENELNDLRGRWQKVQGSFVDEPRSAVHDADELVASTLKRLAEVFSAERSKLEGEWSRGDEVSTEDLRQTLRSYRSFFDRLLTV